LVIPPWRRSFGEVGPGNGLNAERLMRAVTCSANYRSLYKENDHETLKNKSSNENVIGKVGAKINGLSHILFDNNIILWIKRIATVARLITPSPPPSPYF
jgi:hypothetical protein